MNQNKLPTEFAPAERASAEEIERQVTAFQSLSAVSDLLDAVPDVLMILNRQRQIVYYNDSLSQALDLGENEALCCRPGETLDCMHAMETEGGCGTTEFCRLCGVANSILDSQEGQTVEHECRITQKRLGDSLDLRVTANLFHYKDEDFTLLSVTDISDEKRREALERIFFHDILNVAGGLMGLSELLADSPVEEASSYSGTIHGLSRQVVQEIKAQRDLLAAEDGELTILPRVLASTELLEDARSFFGDNPCAEGKTIRIEPDAQRVEFVSDVTLLTRVLNNVIKNALEATNPDGTVLLGCGMEGDEVAFRVHNSSVMSRDVQLQVFQRSFSTKGRGRGLGTYSMKLLSERFLHGRVSFTSSPEEGTIFTARYPLDIESAKQQTL